jgi:hypothetical protein
MKVLLVEFELLTNFSTLSVSQSLQRPVALSMKYDE